MNDTLQIARDFLASDRGTAWFKAGLLLLIGLILGRVLGATTGRLLRGRVSPQRLTLARRLVSYGTFAIFLVSALREAGFDLSVVLGAAGVLTVALGFAAQTSVSNLISGLFLIGERAFEVGETITIDNVTGEVLAVDWMSVKLRTFDNLLVRLPNEMVLKARITNLSRFPIRRLDQLVGVAYGSDLDQVEAVLMEVASQEPLCLDEPKPILFHQGFGESSVQLQFSVWFLTPNLPELRNRLPRLIDQAFRRHGIEIPFPQRAVTLRHEGRNTTPPAPRDAGGSVPIGEGSTTPMKPDAE